MENLSKPAFFRIEPKTYELLQAEAESRHLKFSDIVREAVYEFIGSHNLTVKHQDRIPDGENA